MFSWQRAQNSNGPVAGGSMARTQDERRAKCSNQIKQKRARWCEMGLERKWGRLCRTHHPIQVLPT